MPRTASHPRGRSLPKALSRPVSEFATSIRVDERRRRSRREGMRPMVPRTAARRPPEICGSPHVTAGCGRQRRLSPGQARAADRFINFDTGGKFPLVGQRRFGSGRPTLRTASRPRCRTRPKVPSRLVSEFATSINFAEEPRCLTHVCTHSWQNLPGGRGSRQRIPWRDGFGAVFRNQYSEYRLAIIGYSDITCATPDCTHVSRMFRQGVPRVSSSRKTARSSRISGGWRRQ